MKDHSEGTGQSFYRGGAHAEWRSSNTRLRLPLYSLTLIDTHTDNLYMTVWFFGCCHAALVLVCVLTLRKRCELL